MPAAVLQLLLCLRTCPAAPPPCCCSCSLKPALCQRLPDSPPRPARPTSHHVLPQQLAWGARLPCPPVPLFPSRSVTTGWTTRATGQLLPGGPSSPLKIFKRQPPAQVRKRAFAKIFSPLFSLNQACNPWSLQHGNDTSPASDHALSIKVPSVADKEALPGPLIVITCSKHLLPVCGTSTLLSPPTNLFLPATLSLRSHHSPV